MFQGLVLGIETSCDETAVAVVDETGRILANVLDSQVDVHARYGGVVPELASRRHMECLENLTKEALKQAQISISQLKGLAVTNGPGLVGALIVGVNFGKSMAYARRLPLVAVNHLEGHLASAWLADPDFPFPALVLIASGGHTHLALVSEPGTYQFVGWTIDDAAGEAFDKGAKMLGLPYPGGPAIETLSLEGSSKAIAFPRPNFHSQDLLFSFSGLKTALLYYLRDTSRNGGGQASREDIAASYQEAIVDVLCEKLFRGASQYSICGVSVVGGVAANSRLREKVFDRAQAQGLSVVLPPRSLCTDNAAMIAAAGIQKLRKSELATWDMEVFSTLQWKNFLRSQVG